MRALSYLEAEVGYARRTHAVTSGCEIRQATLIFKPGFFLELIIWLALGPDKSQVSIKEKKENTFRKSCMQLNDIRVG